MLYALDLLGTFVFAISGAFRAVKYELDLLGVLILAAATGVGGGIVRDLLLGATPPAAFSNEIYLLICVAGGVIVFVGAPRIARRWDMVVLFDAVGLGVFAAIGAAKAHACHIGPVGVVLMAATTAAGGGVIRDMLVSEIPAALKSDFYATAALIGGVVYLGGCWLGLPEGVNLTVTAVATVALRFLAMHIHFGLPRVKSLPDSPSNIARAAKLEREAREVAECAAKESDEGKQ